MDGLLVKLLWDVKDTHYQMIIYRGKPVKLFLILTCDHPEDDQFFPWRLPLLLGLLPMANDQKWAYRIKMYHTFKPCFICFKLSFLSDFLRGWTFRWNEKLLLITWQHSDNFYMYNYGAKASNLKLLSVHEIIYGLWSNIGVDKKH